MATKRENNLADIDSGQIKRSRKNDLKIISEQMTMFHVDKIECVKIKKRTIEYDQNKKEFRIKYLENFVFENFVEEISNICHDCEKIYPLCELKLLQRLRYFVNDVEKISAYLKTEECVRILKLKSNEIYCEKLIVQEYDTEYGLCGLSVNSVDFHFYSPSRFFEEYNLIVNNISSPMIKEKVISDVLIGLTDCIKNKKISENYKNETKCWIDYYSTVNGLYIKNEN